MYRITILAVILIVTGSAAAQNRGGEAIEKVRKVIEASNAVYSDLANKNDGSILTRYTDDACLLPAHAAVVCGKANISAFFKDGPKVHSVFTIHHLYGDGENFVTEESHYVLTDLSGNKLDEGKVMVVWKKTADGWKMHRDMFSSDLPVKH